MLRVILIAALCAHATGQLCEPAWGTAYEGGRLDGAAGTVWDMIDFDFGQGPRLVAGGRFRSAGSGAASNIARTTEAQGWEGIGEGLNGPVYALEAFNDGGGLKLYAGGDFGATASERNGGLRRWNGTAWERVQGPDGPVQDLLVYNDGTGLSLYATGSFRTVNGAPISGIAKWDGAAWRDVGGGAPDGSGASMCVWDGPQGRRLALGGTFARLGGAEVNNAGLWDGSAWSAIPGLTDTTQVLSVGTYVKPGTRELWIATIANTNPLRKWNGSSLQNVPLYPTAFNRVFRMAQAVENGEQVLLVAGSFQKEAGGARNLLKWNGSQWSNVVAASSSPAGPIYAVAYHQFTGDASTRLCAGGALYYTVSYGQPGGSLYTGPVLTSAPDRSVFRSLTDTLTVPGVRALEYAPVAGVDVLYAAGYFRPAFATNPNVWFLARWMDGAWRPLDYRFGAETEALARFGDDLIMGGSFIGGRSIGLPDVSAQYVVRFDGATFHSMPGTGAYGNGVTAPVRCMISATQDENPVVYASLKSSYNSVQKWDGTAWTTVTELTNCGPNGFAFGDIGEGPTLYCAGTFYGLSPSPSVAKAGPQGWRQVAAEPVYGSGVAVKVGDVGAGPRLFAAGMLSVPVEGQLPAFVDCPVAVLEGSRWQPLGANMTGLANSIEIFDDGTGPKLFATGDLSIDGQDTRIGRNIARFNGARWEAVDGGADGVGYVLRAPFQTRGRLLVGGDFSHAGGVAAYGVAEFVACPPCPADFDQSGGVDGADVEAFFTQLEAGVGAADVNGDGSEDGADVEYFFLAWQGGGC